MKDGLFPDTMTIPFTRKEFSERRPEILSRGRWANADLFRYEAGKTAWIIKDFSPCSPLVKYTWGRCMVGRELRALQRLEGIKGIPEKPFRLDRFALSYMFVPGTTLKEARKKQKPGPEYFLALEKLVQEMHRRNIVHLDIRYMRNILVTDDGSPALLDFQSSLSLDNTPRIFHRFLKDIDISGVYKCWRKVNPPSIDTKRLELLAAMEKKRSLWIFKGYPMGTRASRR
ncbi:MAG: RIO1 family regulatory kinase/ATPase [Pseudomonadota bacterium]